MRTSPRARSPQCETGASLRSAAATPAIIVRLSDIAIDRSSAESSRHGRKLPAALSLRLSGHACSSGGCPGGSFLARAWWLAFAGGGSGDRAAGGAS